MRIPKGYKLKTNKGKPLKFDKGLGRYLWCPKENDLFFAPEIKKIFRYLGWNRSPGNTDGYLVLLDGYGKVKELDKRNGFWVNNIEVRECIPIQRS